MNSVVKLMKEQGNQFDWSQIAIDIPSLPCFKPEAEWPCCQVVQRSASLADILAEGYTTVYTDTGGFIVRVTGEDPSVSVLDNADGAPVFEDCEPVVVSERTFARPDFDCLTDNRALPLVPIRAIDINSNGHVKGLVEMFGVRSPSAEHLYVTVTTLAKSIGRNAVFRTVVALLPGTDDGGGGGGGEQQPR